MSRLRARLAARRRRRALAEARAEWERRAAKAPPVPFKTRPGDWRDAG